MRKLFSVFLISFLALPVMAYATWQVADSFHGTVLNPDLQPAATIQTSDTPDQYQVVSPYSFKLQKGWLKHNVINMADKIGWTVNWQASRNYRVVTNTTIAGKNFPDVLSQLLSHYPLKASFNNPMKTVIISNQ
mgnify:FL=1